MADEDKTQEQWIEDLIREVFELLGVDDEEE
jgi:hypothetical protein